VNGNPARRGLMLLILAAVLLPEPGHAGPETPIQLVIRQDARWDGQVKVDGVVIVAKGAGLSVAPGTRVIFSVRDDDGDGIGDSELRVEGSLTVAGTGEDPVTFTSAADHPEPADWKYIMINHAEGASISNAVVEYAYSGIQVHYTRGSFSGIVSRHNVDGFRFSTAPVTLENSLLTENTNGIRFEERGAGAVIRHNRITRNLIGVFAVIKCRGLSTFENNGIDNNSDYAVKVGIEQRDDIPMKGNWWGTDDPGKIQGSFFDGSKEPDLGKVEFQPYLTNIPNMLRSDRHGK